MKVLALSLAVVFGVPAAASAQTADVAGKWDVSISTSQGAAPGAVLTIKKEGEKLIGVLSSAQGDVPADVTLKDKDVSIVCSVQLQGGSLVISFSGKVDGNSMGGQVDFGGRGQGTWSAKRADAPPAGGPGAAAALDVTGVWTFDVTTAAGSGTPTLTFKQAGEKLTGHYSGQLGEADLTGTIKGTAIEFAFDVNLEGNALHIVYTGVAEKEAMKGAVKLGGLGDGTFTAKRKPQ